MYRDYSYIYYDRVLNSMRDSKSKSSEEAPRKIGYMIFTYVCPFSVRVCVFILIYLIFLDICEPLFILKEFRMTIWPVKYFCTLSDLSEIIR